jgi:hypothetical protein
MIFSIQHFLEDHFNRLGFSDVDQYAIKVANLFARNIATGSEEEVLISLHRIRTAFFRNNASVNRPDFERDLLSTLSRKFKKKINSAEFPGGILVEKVYFKNKRKTIELLLEKFRSAVESRAIDTFWHSRIKRKLARRPERLGQGLLAIYIKGVFLDSKRGIIIRELFTGIGFVDVAIIIANIPHLIEIKMLTSGLIGVDQLRCYMRQEERREGWLVLFDARQQRVKPPLPQRINTADGRIRIVSININPSQPSKS